MTNLDNSRGVFRKSYTINKKPKQGFRREIIVLVQFVCHLAMLKGFDSFYDVVYDEVTKTHHAVMRARWGAVQLENAVPTKRIGWQCRQAPPPVAYSAVQFLRSLSALLPRIDIKLADNKPILTLHWMLLEDRSTKRHSCVCTQHFPVLKANYENSITYWQ